MLLLPEHRAIFVHIPKTGGQTLERLLGHAHQRNHHAIRGLPDDWPQWFRFTFVRHPLDRFISACNYSVDMARRHPSRYNHRASLGSVEHFHNDLHTLVRLLAIDRATIRRLARLFRHDLKVLGYKANRFP